MPDKPRRIDLSPEDLKALLERIKPVLSDQDYEAIKAMVETIEALNQVTLSQLIIHLEAGMPCAARHGIPPPKNI